MSHLRILVVDDKRSAADTLARLLRRDGDDVRVAYNGDEAISALLQAAPDVIITDLVMEPTDGMAVLEVARAQRPPIEVILMTAHGAIEIAVDAMRLGARDFLTKPVAFQQVRARLAPLRGGSSVTRTVAPSPFMQNSEISKAFYSTLTKAAMATSNVLIEGEIGSGRLHAARILHNESTASTLPCVIRDIARDTTWPEKGTVILPNIGSLQTDLQLKLLRELNTLPSNVRLISTSKNRLLDSVAAKKFNAGLYYAVAVVQLNIPPLRTRQDDIIPLMESALKTLAQRFKKQEPVLSPTHKQKLVAHNWPGNIRELFNLAERTVVLGTHNLNFGNASKPRAATAAPNLEKGFDLAKYLESIEENLLTAAMDKANGDRHKVGEMLGVARNTLRYKLRKYNLID
jgi:DNA-binding NtrC family response regulator